MINFKYFATKAAYTGATVASDSICFVADEKTIYTHGTAFNGQGSIDLSAYIKGVTASGVLTAVKSGQTVTLTHNDSTLAGGTYGPTADVTGNEGNTIVIPQITTDDYGHITGITPRTYTSKNTTYASNVSKTGAATAGYIPAWNANSTSGSAGVLKGGYSVDSTLGTATTAIPTSKAVSDAISAASENTATLKVGSATDKKISTAETSSAYIQFTGGTNKFTVTDGATSFDVAVTPSINNNVTGSSLTADKIVLGNGNSNIKGSTYGITTTAPAGTSTDGTIPTSKAVNTAIESALTSALKYKGTVGTGGTTASLPASHKVGDVYVVKTNGTFAGKACEVGDYIICNTDGTSATDSHWDVVNGENQVDNKSVSLAAAGATATIATVDGTDITITTPSTWTGLGKTGTVTSVGISNGGMISVSGSPITASGSITLTHATPATGTAYSFSKVSTDTYGHVNGKSAVTKADITGLLGDYVTSVNGSTGAVTVATPGTLDTTATTAQTATAGESLSGAITLHKVSKTGDYSDLLNKPTIPAAAKSGKLMLQGGTSTATDSGFNANSSSNQTITFKVGSGNAITSITTSGATVTINGGTFTNNAGTVTKVSVGEGLAGSDITATGTISHATAYTAATTAGSSTSRVYLKTLSLDKFGHVTGVSTGTETVVNTDRYVNSAAFASTGTNGANGVKMTLTRAGSDTATVTATMAVASTTSAGVMSGAMVGQLNYITGSTTATLASSTLTINAVNRLNYYEPTGNPTVTLAVPAAANWVGPEYHLIIKGAATLKIPTTLNSSPVYYNGDLLAATGTMVCDVTEEVNIIKAGSAYYVRTSTWSIE